MTARKDGKPKKRKALSVAQRKYAKGRAKGMTMAQAAAYAGKTGARARARVTGAMWERDPRIKELMRIETEKEMNATEVKNIRAAQARGEIPTKVVTKGGAKSASIEKTYDSDAALAAQSKMLGLNSETHKFEMPGDRDEALAEIQAVLKLFGVEASVQEIAAKLEAASE